jgi:hypothetical protein
MAKILGLADIAVDGTVVLSGDDSTLEPGGVERKVVKGNKVQGYSEAAMESTLEVNVAIDDTFSIDFFRNITNSTITFTADTGQVWSIAGAWCSKPPGIAQKDGRSKVTFTGPPATEILA